MTSSPNKKVEEQIYQFEVQDSTLNQSLLSGVGSVASDDEQPGKRPIPLDQEDDHVVGRFNPHQTPASLKMAEMYWESTGIGQKSANKEGKELCPYSLEPKLQKYPLLTNPLKINGWGTTIQFYFLFCLCCFILVIVEFFGFVYITMVSREDYCQKNNLGQNCSFFDLESHKLGNPKDWFNGSTPEIQQKAAIGYIFVYMSIYVMYIVVIVFTVLKVKLRLKYREQMKETIASEFTIMAEGVDASMDGAEEKVTEFIKTLINREGSFDQPTFTKLVIAKASGCVTRAKEELKNKKEDLEAIQREMKRERFDDQPQKTKNRIKIFKGLEKTEQKKIEKITKRINKLETRRILLKNKDKNSIAFISFETNIQKDQVLQAYKNIYERSFFPLCNEKPKYRLSQASEPDNIAWDKIGFTPCQAVLRACISRPLIGLLVPFFIVLFFFVNVVFTACYSVFKTRFIDTILSMALFLVIKIFTFVTLKMIDALSNLELSHLKDSYASRKIFLTSILKVFYIFLGYLQQGHNNGA